ncbi:hypothetical protein [Paracoccus ravus]|uniref:hypothetical protein n=1 Tax=Paracoccus ravus TaxID=2447760 RepID=UPI00106EABCA|nr:hypothetical protein [Paracoccus ravus]
MAQVNCDYCGGYGHLPGKSADKVTTCPKCHGTGKVREARTQPQPGLKSKAAQQKSSPPLWFWIVAGVILLVILGG